VSKKILIIEDEKSIRDNLRILLEAEKFVIETASNGKEGLEKSIEFNPELIICDIMMPDMDGYQVLQSLSEDSKFKLTPFIFLTAKIEKSDLRRGMNLGADDYIFKPFDADELLSAVRTRLNKYEQFKAVIEKTKSNSREYSLLDKILFRVGDHSISVPVNNILYLNADRQYTNIYSLNKKHFIVKKSLSDWEEALPQKNFVRVHRSVIVNMNYVDKIEKDLNNHYKIRLNNSEKIIEVSRRYYKKLKTIINK
jgi:DNA-binding LytR/AlgR family response regulator